jgi:hypothetical protein
MLTAKSQGFYWYIYRRMEEDLKRGGVWGGRREGMRGEGAFIIPIFLARFGMGRSFAKNLNLCV